MDPFSDNTQKLPSYLTSWVEESSRILLQSFPDVRNYTMPEGYCMVNGSLRGRRLTTRSYNAVARMLSAMNSLPPLPHPLTVYRGVYSYDHGERNITYDSFIDGQIVTDDGFNSSSFKADIAERFSIDDEEGKEGWIMKFEIPAGMRVIPLLANGLSINHLAGEIILPPRVEWRVVSKQRNAELPGTERSHDIIGMQFASQHLMTDDVLRALYKPNMDTDFQTLKSMLTDAYSRGNLVMLTTSKDLTNDITDISYSYDNAAFVKKDIEQLLKKAYCNFIKHGFLRLWMVSFSEALPLGKYVFDNTMGPYSMIMAINVPLYHWSNTIRDTNGVSPIKSINYYDIAE